MHSRSEENSKDDHAAADSGWPDSETPPADDRAPHHPQAPVDLPGAPHDSDEFDEIEGRAAQLMARMEAQRLQRQAQHPEPVDDISVETARESPESAGQYESEFDDYINEPTTGPVDVPLRHNGVIPLPDERPVASDDAVVPAEPERPTRQMVLPPWQSYIPSIDPDFGAAPQWPADSEAPPPQAWHGDPPVAEPDWQRPSPAWSPGFPPPPPGWQGPLPWLLPPDQPPPDRSGRIDSPSAGPRHLRDRPGQRTSGVPGRPAPTDFGSPQAFPMPPSLDEAEIDNTARHAPESGWRRAVYKATGGHLNPGLSRKERDRQALFDQIRQPIAGDFRIAVLSLKGGVGKTTTTLGLGSALATVRTDRVIAIDANPDRGTLAERVPDSSTTSTVRDLLRDNNIKRYADVRNHTLMSPSRLEVLASEQDPEVAEVFGETDYRRTMEILRHYYNIILTDCGTGIMHSAMAGVLDFANAIVLVISAAIDSARSASATLDWLTQHGHGALVRDAHVVLTAPKAGSAALKVDKVVEHFGARCKTTHVIPFERHLAEGAHFDFELLTPATSRAYLELAGAVSEKFSRQHPAYPVR